MLNEFALKFWKVSEEFLTEPRRNAASDLSRFFFSRVFVNSFHCIRKYWGKWKNMYVWTQFYGNNRRYAYLVMACIEMRNIKFVYKVNRLANENHTFFFFLFFLPTEKSTKVSEETPNFLPVRLTQLLCQFLLVPNAYEPSVLRSRFLGCHSRETAVNETMINLALIFPEDLFEFSLLNIHYSSTETCQETVPCTQ